MTNRGSSNRVAISAFAAIPLINFVSIPDAMLNVENECITTFNNICGQRKVLKNLRCLFYLLTSSFGRKRI